MEQELCIFKRAADAYDVTNEDGRIYAIRSDGPSRWFIRDECKSGMNERQMYRSAHQAFNSIVEARLA